MSSLAPPISIHLTRRQLRWLDGRRRLGTLTRSAALRQAIDALIQQEEGTDTPPEASSSGEAAKAPRQLELTSQAQSQAQPTTPAGEG